MQAMKNFLKMYKWYELVFMLVSFIALITLGIIFRGDNIYLLVFELISTICGLVAAMTNFKRKKYAFIFYSVYVTIYGIISFFNKQYGEGVINLAFNLPLYLYTLYKLYFKIKDNNSEFQINSLNLKGWIIIIVFIPVVTVGYGFLLKYLNSSLPFENALATSLALIAAFLASKAIKEQWLFFLFYSIVLTYIWTSNYINGGTSGFTYLVLNIIYIIFNLYGFILWYKLAKKPKEIKE